MVKKPDKNKARLTRHKRVRGKVSGTAERPRLNVFRSTNNIYAQEVRSAVLLNVLALMYSAPPVISMHS